MAAEDEITCSEGSESEQWASEDSIGATSSDLYSGDNDDGHDLDNDECSRDKILELNIPSNVCACCGASGGLSLSLQSRDEREKVQVCQQCSQFYQTHFRWPDKSKSFAQNTNGSETSHQLDLLVFPFSTSEVHSDTADHGNERDYNVVWSEIEKKRLFRSLSRRTRYQFANIAVDIGTKTKLECQLFVEKLNFATELYPIQLVEPQKKKNLARLSNEDTIAMEHKIAQALAHSMRPSPNDNYQAQALFNTSFLHKLSKLTKISEDLYSTLYDRLTSDFLVPVLESLYRIMGEKCMIDEHGIPDKVATVTLTDVDSALMNHFAHRTNYPEQPPDLPSNVPFIVKNGYLAMAENGRVKHPRFSLKREEFFGHLQTLDMINDLLDE